MSFSGKVIKEHDIVVLTEDVPETGSAPETWGLSCSAYRSPLRSALEVTNCDLQF